MFPKTSSVTMVMVVVVVWLQGTQRAARFHDVIDIKFICAIAPSPPATLHWCFPRYYISTQLYLTCCQAMGCFSLTRLPSFQAKPCCERRHREPSLALQCNLHRLTVR